MSSRMGHDKALIRLHSGENADMLARTTSLLNEYTEEVWVVGRIQPGYVCVPDLAPGCGPVGGIATALAHRDGVACLVLSCDLPFMERGVVKRLVETRNQRPAGINVTLYQQQETGYPESLVAIYEPGARPYFERCAAARLLKTGLVVPPEEQLFIPYSVKDSLPFFNINYPVDLEVARRIMLTLGAASQ